MRRLVVIAIVLWGLPLAGQASLVPVDHPVYEWLHRQRVRGHLPRYDYEALPLTRGAIAGMLDTLAIQGGLGWAERALLTSYRAEFMADTALPVVTLLQGRDSTLGGTLAQKARLMLSDATPHLYRSVGSDGNATLDYMMSIGSWAGSEVAGGGLDQYLAKHVRFYGTIYDHFGLHLDAVNASGGPMIRFHPQWGTTNEALKGNGAAVWAQGFVSAVYRAFRFDAGSGTQRLGVPAREAVILRPFSANFDWVRWSFTSGAVQYTQTHGALVGERYVADAPNAPGVLTGLAPARFMAIRRLQLRPARWLQLGFSEAASYNSRGVDLAYLNPVVPFFVAQFSTNDRDNWVSYLDAVLRPVPGVELAGTLGIDDMSSFADWLRPTGSRSKNDSTTKLLYQGWGTIALPGGTDVFGGFVRVEPFFYTHRFALNTFEQWGLPLGASVGPNADEWTVGVRQWLPWRAALTLSLSGGRHGLNVVDAADSVIQDVGGSLTSIHASQRILFLAGDVHHTRTWRVEAFVEPVRGFRLDLAWQRRVVTRGTRLPEFDVLRIGAELMFYPVDLLLLPF